jgi:hypothetical protein
MMGSNFDVSFLRCPNILSSPDTLLLFVFSNSVGTTLSSRVFFCNFRGVLPYSFDSNCENEGVTSINAESLFRPSVSFDNSPRLNTDFILDMVR